MSGRDEASLLAVLLGGPSAAHAARTAWDAGEAVAVLDPAAPATDTARRLDALRPTHLLDRDGRTARHGGEPVGTGTAALIATSGTTGEPRFVALTAQALRASARAVSAALDVSTDDRWLACLPLHHVAGLAIIARGHMTDVPIEVHPRFDVDAVVVSNTSLVSLVPTMLTRLLDHGPSALARFRRVLLGGGPIPSALLARACEAGATVVTTYGLTETGGGCVHDGYPLDGVELTFDDTTGEILVRGPVVMHGYHRAPEATTRAFTADGWLRTGDAGTTGPDGRLRVTERLRDLVITGGINVSPTVVETVLARHPGIADVCVAGRPDSEWDEQVVAYIVPTDPHAPPSLHQIRAFAGNELPSAQLPREVIVVDTIPRTVGGKPLRRQLRSR